MAQSASWNLPTKPGFHRQRLPKQYVDSEGKVNSCKLNEVYNLRVPPELYGTSCLHCQHISDLRGATSIRPDSRQRRRSYLIGCDPLSVKTSPSAEFLQRGFGIPRSISMDCRDSI